MWDRLLLKTRRGVFEVLRRGAGPPLCVTHLYSAFNPTGDLYADSFTALRTVYLVNLRGAGASEPSQEPSDLSMDAAVLDLEAIRAALGQEMWDFAGHSTGGMLGLLYAVNQGAGLRSLIAVGAAASHRYAQSPQCIYHPAHPQFQRMQDLFEAQKAPGLGAQEYTRLARERTMLSLHAPERYDEYFGGTVHKRICVPRLDYYGREDFPRFDVAGQLGGSAVAALAACGRYDVQCPLPCSEEIAARMPHARLLVFERSGHYPFVEERGAFQAAAQAFLEDPR